MFPHLSRGIASTALLALAGLSAGCGGSTEPRLPTTAALGTRTVSLTAIGQTAQLAATITDQNGRAIASPALTWTSSDEAVATVSSGGVVTATGNGTATITVAAGAASAQAEVSVAQAPSQIQKVAGDAQTAAPGRPVAIPLTVRIDDAGGSPVAGITVSFTATGGTVATPSAVTGADGRASTGYTPLSTGAQQVTASVPDTPLATGFTETGVSPFHIELQFLSSVTPAQQQAFDAARERWESLIVADVPDVPALNAAAGTCGANSPRIQRAVDDVLILVTVKPIDGVGGLLGGSAPCYFRSTSRLPILGLMQFDADDLDVLASGGLLGQVITHEMAHVLGFGTIWSDLGLLANPSLPGGADPHFTGSRARTAFDAVGGASYTASLKVPVEKTGGLGSADAHWRESVFGNELMTGPMQAGVNPLSRVTAASMADLGYAVNLAAADPFTLAAGLRVFDAGRTIELEHDVFRFPRREVDESGRVLRVIDP
jgi:hypothetical protein